jgi:hypothetical protein
MPDFFDRYIHLVSDFPLPEALAESSTVFQAVSDPVLRLGEKVYAPAKWTSKDILQHCIDTERILSYRALRFARNDQTRLPGFDESLFAQHSSANDRTVSDLLDEFALVRQSTLAMFLSFTPEMILRHGICFERQVSVLALGFIIAGHALHHRAILEQRYFPLLD